MKALNVMFGLFSYDLRADYVTYWSSVYSGLRSGTREEEEDGGMKEEEEETV